MQVKIAAMADLQFMTDSTGSQPELKHFETLQPASETTRRVKNEAQAPTQTKSHK